MELSHNHFIIFIIIRNMNSLMVRSIVAREFVLTLCHTTRQLCKFKYYFFFAIMFHSFIFRLVDYNRPIMLNKSELNMT